MSLCYSTMDSMKTRTYDNHTGQRKSLQSVKENNNIGIILLSPNLDLNFFYYELLLVWNGFLQNKSATCMHSGVEL